LPTQLAMLTRLAPLSRRIEEWTRVWVRNISLMTALEKKMWDVCWMSQSVFLRVSVSAFIVRSHTRGRCYVPWWSSGGGKRYGGRLHYQLWYKNKWSPVRDNRFPEVYYTTGLSERMWEKLQFRLKSYYANVSVMTFRVIRDVGSLPWIDREVCGLFLAIVNSYRQTFPYSSIHVNIPCSKVEWVDCPAWQLQHKLDSRLKSVTTVNTAKIWVKMKPILW